MQESSFASRQNMPADRPLRLISSSQGPAALPTASSAPPPTSSPALRRLQQNLEAARAEAHSLRDILEELPAILERKFQQRLQNLLAELQLMEQENAFLRQQLAAVLGGAGDGMDSSAVSPATLPSLPSAAETAEIEGAPITAGLGLRRALRHLHR